VEGERRALLVGLVLPFAQIDPTEGVVYFTKKAKDLTAKRKIMVYLLARLALASRRASTHSASATLHEIGQATALPGGTVRPRVMDLIRDRLVVKTKSGYAVPSNMLDRVAEELTQTLDI